MIPADLFNCSRKGLYGRLPQTATLGLSLLLNTMDTNKSRSYQLASEDATTLKNKVQFSFFITALYYVHENA